MTSRKLSVAIVGAGIGGLTAAATLRRVGIEVQVYEQASKFARIGAGIQQAPKAIKVLRELGLEPHLRSVAFQPERAFNREWDNGKLTNEYRMGSHAEERFGAPYLLMHRGDLHAAIASTICHLLPIVWKHYKLCGGAERIRTVSADSATDCLG
jgi:6-hydroxynicotinate 3-monooxygenase